MNEISKESELVLLDGLKREIERKKKEKKGKRKRKKAKRRRKRNVV